MMYTKKRMHRKMQEKKTEITHLVNILSYKRHQIRNPLPNCCSNNCMAPDVNKLIYEFDLHIQHYVLVLAPVGCTMKIYPFQHRPSNEIFLTFPTLSMNRFKTMQSLSICKLKSSV